MKTMTCRQLGGACDLALHGGDHNEVIKAQDEHEPALRDMKWRWKRPVSGLKRYRQVQHDVEALPVDAGRV